MRGVFSCLRAFALGAVLFCLSVTVAFSEELVDLELVLAIDASGSVDAAEYELQLQGTANGFRDAAVQQAIQSGPLGRIAVALVLWADATVRTKATAWHIVSSPSDAERLADLIEQLPRSVGGGTGVGMAIAASIRLIDDNGITATRRVVDVSGDGPETPPRQVGIVLAPQARAMAAARDITINGLAILSDVPDLASWYSSNVTAGPGSFVMSAADYTDFERAMRAKLLREILPPVAVLRPCRHCATPE